MTVKHLFTAQRDYYRAMTTTSETSTARADGRLRTLGIATFGALLLQLLVGISTTFWVELPEDGDAQSRMKDATNGGILMAHITIGTVLAVLAVILVIIAIRQKNRTWTIASIVGLIGIFVSYFSGSAFLNPPENDSLSFAMTLGLAIAIGAYVYGLATRPKN